MRLKVGFNHHPTVIHLMSYFWPIGLEWYASIYEKQWPIIQQFQAFAENRSFSESFSMMWLHAFVTVFLSIVHLKFLLIIIIIIPHNIYSQTWKKCACQCRSMWKSMECVYWVMLDATLCSWCWRCINAILVGRSGSTTDVFVVDQ